ncbi:hypothetical protein FRC12_024390 [Ceratobasidium sp. 428]|nr:hypothetical protein FRC12_024390 [Ceratobasidium sp. 428]
MSIPNQGPHIHFNTPDTTKESVAVPPAAPVAGPVQQGLGSHKRKVDAMSAQHPPAAFSKKMKLDPNSVDVEDEEEN